MITLASCKEILTKNDYHLADSEIKELRDYLYFLASLQIEIDNNNEIKPNTNEECDNLL